MRQTQADIIEILTNSPDWSERTYRMAWYIDCKCPPKIFKAIATNLTHDNRHVLCLTMYYLGRIGRHTPKIQSKLVSFLEHEDKNIANEAAKTLALIGKPNKQTLKALEKASKSEDKVVANTATFALGRVRHKQVLSIRRKLGNSTQS